MRTKLSKQRWRGGKECNIRTDNISEGFLPLCWKNAPTPFLALPSSPFLCLGCSQWKGGHLKRTAITAYLQIYQILIALARFCFWQLKGWLPPSWHEWPPRPWTDSPRGDPYPGQPQGTLFLEFELMVWQLSLSRLVPEFPSETLPTLAAMVTGQHSEVRSNLVRWESWSHSWSEPLSNFVLNPYNHRWLAF